MDGKGRWIDNVFIERPWRSVKYEEVHVRAYANGTEARMALTRNFGFYNARASHQSPDYRTPDEGVPRRACAQGSVRHDTAAATRRASAACGGRLAFVETIDEEKRPRDDHHQPLRPVHLSDEEICPNKRSHLYARANAGSHCLDSIDLWSIACWVGQPRGHRPLGIVG